jgi:hypothetical protein
MAVKYLKPMLDAGSSRVFNCNETSRKLQKQDAAATPFFKTPRFNALVFIKDAVPEAERRGNAPPVGTKLYVPFNEEDIYEGGRTVFLHDPQLAATLAAHFGLSDAAHKPALDHDLRVMKIIDGLPSLDPFLMKDVFARENIAVNEAYFEISPEQWREIEIFILQRFEPLVKAAFPDAMSSDEKARQLVEKIWEAKDTAALAPLIAAFRLPPENALEIFSAWKGINFYSFQYHKVRPLLIDLAKWLNAVEIPVGALPSEDRSKLLANRDAVKEQLRRDWQSVEVILREYDEAYDKMFKSNAGSTQFLTFLRGSRQAYWNLGSGIGKTNHTGYCWDLLTKRYRDRKLPVVPLQETIRILFEIMQPAKKAAATAAW